MRILLYILPFFIACQGSGQTEQPATESAILYDGKFEGQGMPPKWLANRHYFQLTVTVKAEEVIWLDSTAITYDELFNTLRDRWQKIRKDDYKGVLQVVLGNERSTNYEFYLQVYQSIKDSFYNEQADWSMKKFSAEPTDLNKEQRRQLNHQIPILINEKEPEGF
ncbi:MAG: hypothetical protein AAGG75_09550 [Bacteroidota bacterium]